MPIEGLFIAIGYKPNTEAFRDWLEVDEKGYLVVHDETGSKIDGVFIAGDVHDHRYRQAVTAAGRRLQGGDRRRALAGSRRASPRPRPPRPGRSARSRALRAPARLGIEPTVQALVARRARRGDHRTRASVSPTRRRPVGVAVLDAGCGRVSPLRPFRPRIGAAGRRRHPRAARAAPPPRRVRDRRPVRPADAFPTASFDVVLSSFTLEHFADPAAALAEHPALAAAGRHARGHDREPAAPVRRGVPGAAAPVRADALQPLVKASRRRRASARRRVQRPGRRSATTLAAAGFSRRPAPDRRPPRPRVGPPPADVRARPRAATC